MSATVPFAGRAADGTTGAPVRPRNGVFYNVAFYTLCMLQPVLIATSLGAGCDAQAYLDDDRSGDRELTVEPGQCDRRQGSGRDRATGSPSSSLRLPRAHLPLPPNPTYHFLRRVGKCERGEGIDGGQTKRRCRLGIKKAPCVPESTAVALDAHLQSPRKWARARQLFFCICVCPSREGLERAMGNEVVRACK